MKFTEVNFQDHESYQFPSEFVKDYQSPFCDAKIHRFDQGPYNFWYCTRQAHTDGLHIAYGSSVHSTVFAVWYTQL